MGFPESRDVPLTRLAPESFAASAVAETRGTVFSLSINRFDVNEPRSNFGFGGILSRSLNSNCNSSRPKSEHVPKAVVFGFGAGADVLALE